MKQRAGRSDDTPYRATPTADYDSDIVAGSSHDVDLHAQLESIRTNGEFTDKQIENLIAIVLKLSDKIWIMRKENENLNIRVDHNPVCGCRCRLSATAVAKCHEAPPPVAKANETKSYRNVLITGSTSSI